ncbi:MAG: hypothetical protein HGA96_11150 [Desulfobulbaceae bacterium]|nr:hypothetical protein [Desulfobulbaceae bacterium]
MEQQGVDFAAIPQTAIRFITSPTAFYREMPKKGGFVEPLLFMVAMGVIGGIIQAVASLVSLNPAASALAGMASLVVIPVMVAIFGFIGAAIMFVIWKLMGSQEDYETAYRCGAYSAAFTPITMLIGLVPYAGSVVGILIMVYLLVVASVEVHKLAANKAWLVFGIIGLLLIFGSISAQLAAKKFAAEMQVNAERMKESADAMQEAGKQIAESAQEQADQSQSGRASSGAAADMREAVTKQMDASIAQMEAEMSSLPAAQQEQMRPMLEQMKQSRSKMR